MNLYYMTSNTATKDTSEKVNRLITLFSKIFIALIIFSSFTSNIILFYNSAKTLHRLWPCSASNIVSRFDKRIECIKKHLPGTGLVGYVSNRAPMEFALTAYILSPLFLGVKKYDRPPHFVEDRSKDYDFIIENSINHKDIIFKNRAQYVKLVDCANGVRLYQNRKMKK